MGTNDNLKDAFAGESQANRMYLAFAKKAEADGFPGIAKLFRATAEAETVHAHAHFRVMGKIKGTEENLQAAIEGEGYEFKEKSVSGDMPYLSYSQPLHVVPGPCLSGDWPAGHTG